MIYCLRMSSNHKTLTLLTVIEAPELVLATLAGTVECVGARKA